MITWLNNLGELAETIVQTTVTNTVTVIGNYASSDNPVTSPNPNAQPSYLAQFLSPLVTTTESFYSYSFDPSLGWVYADSDLQLISGILGPVTVPEVTSGVTTSVETALTNSELSFYSYTYSETSDPEVTGWSAYGDFKTFPMGTYGELSTVPTHSSMSFSGSSCLLIKALFNQVFTYQVDQTQEGFWYLTSRTQVTQAVLTESSSWTSTTTCVYFNGDFVTAPVNSSRFPDPRWGSNKALLDITQGGIDTFGVFSSLTSSTYTIQTFEEGTVYNSTEGFEATRLFINQLSIPTTTTQTSPSGSTFSTTSTVSPPENHYTTDFPEYMYPFDNGKHTSIYYSPGAVNPLLNFMLGTVSFPTTTRDSNFSWVFLQSTTVVGAGGLTSVSAASHAVRGFINPINAPVSDQRKLVFEWIASYGDPFGYAFYPGTMDPGDEFGWLNNPYSFNYLNTDDFFTSIDGNTLWWKVHLGDSHYTTSSSEFSTFYEAGSISTWDTTVTYSAWGDFSFSVKSPKDGYTFAMSWAGAVGVTTYFDSSATLSSASSIEHFPYIGNDSFLHEGQQFSHKVFTLNEGDVFHLSPNGIWATPTATDASFAIA